METLSKGTNSCNGDPKQDDKDDNFYNGVPFSKLSKTAGANPRRETPGRNFKKRKCYTFELLRRRARYMNLVVKNYDDDEQPWTVQSTTLTRGNQLEYTTYSVDYITDV